MLKTTRLTIQELRAQDWESIKAIAMDFSRSEYALYDMPLPANDDEIKSLCEKFSASGLWFTVWLADRIIGYICLHLNGTAYDLGFSFCSDCHGKGFAFEACSAVMEYFTKERNATVFTAGTALKNEPSCRLLKKLGFTLKDTEILAFHKDGNGNDIIFEGGIFEAKGMSYGGNDIQKPKT